MNLLINFIFKTSKSKSGLLLLVAIQKHSGDLYEQSGAQMEGLASLEMAVSGCTALWYWIKVSAVNLPLF